MISTLKPRFRQYKTAWFVKEGEDVNKRKPFRYTIVNEAEKAYSQVVRNLVSTRNSFVIQTNYMFDFEIGDHVSINSGQMEGFTGTIESIDAQTRKVSVRAVTFNREMLVELDVGQISHID